VFRALYFAPYVLGVAVVAVLWRYLLDANIGLVNHYLGVSIPWLTALPWAWIALVGVTVWWTLGFNAVIYLAALQDISPDLYEAAHLDGANAWQRFRYVTLPGLRPVLLFITSVTIIASVNMFGQSFLMTQGGPGTDTRTAIYQIADTGLTNFNSGVASAMSMIFSFFLMVVSLLVFAAYAFASVLGNDATPVLRWLVNSVVAAGLQTLLIVVTGSMAAYAFARLEFPGRRVLFALVLATLFVPPVILLIPNYLITSELGWLDTLAAVVVRIVLPPSRPALVTLAILSFLTNWNDFLWPVYVLFSPENQTLPAGLSTLQNANAVRYDLLMAGAVIASVPVLVLYLAAQRYVVEGVSRAGLKG
jgi:ABC-type glycerol-3-phosphate transport system permease component